MHCSACQSTLTADAAFCHRCGTPLASVGTATPPTRDGLPHALNRLLPTGYLSHVLTAEGKSHSERRVVTTLFIDLVNSTGIAEQLDPEDVTELINLAFDAMAGPIRRYEGTIARLMGDGMLCLFGAPVAHEDDPLRACRAGLEVVEAFRRLAPETCARYGLACFTVRAGISTGLAVVGEVGTSDRAEYTAIGDAVNLAARLQAVTEPGTVVISRDTWQLVKDVLPCKDLGQMTVRGKSRPIAVYRLVPSGGRVKQPKPGKAHLPLSGRQEELALCRRALHELNEGRGSLLLLTGAAGLGKSRLIAEARANSPKAVAWVEARCHAHTRSISYWTTRELLRDLLGLGLSTSSRRLAARLRESVSALVSSASEGPAASEAPDELSLSLCAVLGHVMHAPLLQREKRYLETLPTQFVHEQIVNSVCRYLHLTARKRPLVLLWEDVQWLDTESRAVLTALAACPQELPLLLVVICRAGREQPTAWLDDLRGSARLPIHSIALGPLGVAECRDLLQNLLSVDEVPEHVATPLFHSAEGNPHFLHELTGSLLDRGHLIRADKERLRACALGKVDVPRSLQAAILTRLDMLDARARRIIQTASVLGRVVDPEVVRRMLHPDMPPEACDEGFRGLLDRNFMVLEHVHDRPVAGMAESPPVEGPASRSDAASRQYLFAQTMIQEVVYDGMLKSHRQQLHHRAGETIEALYSDHRDQWAPILAYHFDRGAHVAKAVRYLSQTAERSSQLYAVDAAAEAYQRALSLVEQIHSQVDLGLVAALREGLGDVYYLSSQYERAQTQYDQAQAAQTSPQRLSALALKRGRLLEKWGRYDEAKRAFESGLEGLAADYDPQLAAKFYAGLCLVYYHLNELGPAGELGQLALELERTTGDERGIAQACNNLGVVCMKRKDWPVAQNYFGECLSLWERMGDSYGLATCCNNLGLAAKELGDWNASTGYFERSLSLFTRLGNKHGMARVYDNLAELNNLLDHPQKVEEYLGKAMTLLAEIGIDDNGPVAEMWQSGVW